MKIAVTGARGFIGRAVCRAAAGAAHETVKLVRGAPAAADEAAWNPSSAAPVPALAECDAVLHLAGENIAAGRWTEERRKALRASRVEATQNLVAGLRELPRRPRTLICASATGYYGDRGDDICAERAPGGVGFLADLCRDWEAAARGAEKLGVRVVCLRLGAALGPGGGILARLRPLYRWGLGGPMGNGRQYVSWVSLTDAVAAVFFALENRAISGPVNVAAGALPQRDFAAAVGAAWNRPAALAAPAFVLRALLGDMAREVLLSGVRAQPAALLLRGFEFTHPDLSSALRAAAD